MQRADFHFDLPSDLIAQEPTPNRGESRLMVLNRQDKSLIHTVVGALPELLRTESLMVFNNTRVRKARILGISENTGASVEFLLVKQQNPVTWEALISRSKRRHAGSRYHFPDGTIGTLAGESGNYRVLHFDTPVDDAWLDTYGHIPLPPYIKRPDTDRDADRYQTVYAAEHGSAAAPTAGLHFTTVLFEQLRQAGVEIAFVTLHVGLGTFLPVRAEQIEDHEMHEEFFEINEKTAMQIETAKGSGRPVAAIGTTSVRAVESAWNDGRIRRGQQSTRIFIYPGYQFRVVDTIFTNFHTPESTLLMLVSAFAGREYILDAYREAITRRYRFFSYGDSMLIL
ncbi:S-adenosylmethionine:tRNA ribosyltransferase-isomerase [Spirochaetia bacterium]|nr:S-adenosylmethionine:tRNA ribosyltransferase-isomerase [Spirochaetia bacterium]GHU29965.1 S-adenosylmethionine:tRNA ribosyltransferase-isomerase [Spirochaetia bacterium]